MTSNKSQGEKNIEKKWGREQYNRLLISSHCKVGPIPVNLLQYEYKLKRQAKDRKRGDRGEWGVIRQKRPRGCDNVSNYTMKIK